MKTCLVLEGGGLRGIYTAGVLDYFLEKNIKIDAIIGTSMGALVGINYVSKQPGRMLRYNLRYCNDKRYMSVKSLFTTGNFINKKFAYYDVPNKYDRFDYNEYKKSKTKLYCTVTNIETGQAEYIDIKDCKRQIEYLRATSAIPLISRVVTIKNKKYLDGGITDSIPVMKAIELGYDKIVVVLTRPQGYKKKNRKNKLAGLFYNRYKNLKKALSSRNASYNQQLENLELLEKSKKIFIIRPSSAINIKRLEKNKDIIKQQYDLGYNDTKNSLIKLNSYLEKK